MKKLYPILGILFLTFSVQAQLYVSPNTYVYTNNQYVYVTGDVNLNTTTSNLYLRNNSQLLQGTTGAGANKGTGNLSVYQEGTVNNYQYNYWCSPVGGVTSSTVINNPFSITQLGVPNVNMNPRSFVANTPTTSYDGSSGSGALSISSRWIYKFITSNVYAQWVRVGTGLFDPGLGFTMKGTSGSDGIIPFTGATANNPGSNQRYDFRGKPNDGLITNLVSLNNYTLVGNPYPSAIDLNMFLGKDGPGPDTIWGTIDDVGVVNNPAIDGTAYFWEQVVKNSHYLRDYEGGYGVYTPAGGYLRADIWNYKGDGSQNTDLNPDGGATTQDGTFFQRRFTPIGQGFMVMGIANGTVSMQNKFRVFVNEGGTSQFAKVAAAPEYFDEIPNVAGTDYTKQKVEGFAPQMRIKTIINENQGIIRTVLGFGAGFTDGFDRAADALSASDTAPCSFYNILTGTDKEYVMSLAEFDINKGYPVGFRNNIEATFRLKAVDFLYGFDENQPVYMHDKLNDTYTDIKNGEFLVTLPAGNVKDRFEITFKNATLSAENPTTSDFVIFQNNTNNVLTIKNPNAIDLANCTLFDITGKIIFNKIRLENNPEYEFSTVGLSDGVYMVKLTTKDNKEVVKKVSISNNK
ncbi:MAG: T9SS sorting signal type C domain-containing protein [Bacteroidota bacterium]